MTRRSADGERPRRRLLAAALATTLLAVAAPALPIAPAHAISGCSQADPDCGGPTDPGGPDPTKAPQPGHVRLSDRQESTLTVAWSVSQYTTSYKLQRAVGMSSTWTDLIYHGVPGPMTRAETGLTPDTRYCYRVVASNIHGASTSPAACAYTRDGHNRPVYRVQLAITTGNVADAGTTDKIMATINGSGVDTSSGETWLDMPGRDMVANTTRSYDLVDLGGITQLGDIHSIVLTKAGNDDWCVKGVKLIVDDQPAFDRTFGPPCEWIRGNLASGAYISHDMLRSSALFNGFFPPIPPHDVNPDGTWTFVLQIPAAELQERIGGIVGDALHGTDGYWGDQPYMGYDPDVDVHTFNDTRADVNLRLAYEVDGPNPDVGVSFRLGVATHVGSDHAWQLDLGMSDVHTDVDLVWWEDLLDTVLPCGPIVSVVEDEGIPFCLAHLADEAGDEVAAQIEAIGASLNLGTQPLSVSAAFDSSDSLRVTFVVDPSTVLGSNPRLPRGTTSTAGTTAHP